jgi:hypothetical protein
MVQAAQEQLEAIHKLECSGKLRELTVKLREAAGGLGATT